MSYPPRGQEYQSSYSHVGDDPSAVQHRKSPSPSHHDTYPTPSYPPPALPPPSPPSPLIQPQPQQQQRVAYPPGQPYSVADLDSPFPQSLNNQISTALFQPYEDQDNEFGDDANLPVLRASSASSPYGRTPQRVPRRYRTLRRVECVYYFYLACPHIRLADPLRSHSLTVGFSMETSCSTAKSQQICLTTAFIKMSANLPTCVILLRLVTRTTSRIMASPSVRFTMTLPVGQSYSSS